MHPDKPGGHNPSAQSELDRVPHLEDQGRTMQRCRLLPADSILVSLMVSRMQYLMHCLWGLPLHGQPLVRGTAALTRSQLHRAEASAE